MTQAVTTFEDPEAVSQARPKRPSRPCAVPESSTASERSQERVVSINRCLDILHEVELLGEGATGALLFEEPEGDRGAILVENGRICWAAVRGQSARMIEVLRGQGDAPDLTDRQFEALLRDCQRAGRPFGEEMVARGVVSEDGLRRALRQHTAEGIALLSHSARRQSYLKHRKQGYAARYTFSTAEVLCAIGALQMPDAAELATRGLQELLPDGVSGVAYARGASARPVAVALLEEVPLAASDLSDMARWASGTWDVSGAIGDRPRLVATSDVHGRSLALWQDEGLMYAALCKNVSSLARVLMGVSRR